MRKGGKMPKKMNLIKAIVLGAAAFVLMTLCWRFMGSLVGTQTGYLGWAWTLVRKLTTLGAAVLAFLGGLK